MSPFVERLVVEFSRKAPKTDLAEECLAAEEVILRFRNTGEATPELLDGLPEAAISAADVRMLTTALKAFVASSPAHQSVGSAIWALTKLNDESLAPFFFEQMRV